ncbi:MAG: AmmeMemoRadiSam system protein A [Candidatus Micrarchaeota archaeon]
MERLSRDEKKFLLSLARNSITHFLEAGKGLLGELGAPGRLLEEGACFVTLKIGGELRGCIGSLEAHRPLAVDVAENAVAAAFGDPRFPPLSRGELPNVRISISVLTAPKPLLVKNADDLLQKLVVGKTGLIVSKGGCRATFLPAVWEELPEKEKFLAHLCLKAGLPPGAWRLPGMRFEEYYAEEFCE